MISFKNVTYTIKNKTILSSITFNIKEKEKVLISGPSGCGKSTIFNLLLNNISLSKGNIYYKKKDISTFSAKEKLNYRQNEIAIIYQKDDLYENLTVNENLSMFYYQKDIDTYLKKTNLNYLKNKKIYQLSGGERQRIAIIKTLLSNCNVLLCDEITSALDEENAKKILEFINKNFKNKTIIYICHNPSLLNDIIDRHIIIKDHKIHKNIIINDIIEKQNQNKLKDRKTLILTSLIAGIKKLTLSSFLIYVFLLISIFVSFNFNDISMYYAKRSYTSYFNYDVVEVKDNNDTIKVDNINSFYSLESKFLNSAVKINNTNIQNIRFYPFNNKDNYTPIVINSLFMKTLNISDIESITINGPIKYQSNKVDIYIENNMFSNACIYYDIKYFSDNLTNNESIILINYDFTNIDERFTNNPLYEIKKEDKPYIDSNAYKDYLTFSLVFDSIKLIISYFLYVILIFCIISAILINFSLIIKDVKTIAIYLSKGYSDFQIVLTYVSPLIVYFIITLLTLLFISIIKLLLITFFIYLASILISYYLIKRKNLHTLLKEDILC